MYADCWNLLHNVPKGGKYKMFTHEVELWL